MPGWIAQWREMMADPTTKIGRPRQVYTGAVERDYVDGGQPLSRGGAGGRRRRRARRPSEAGRAQRAGLARVRSPGA